MSNSAYLEGLADFTDLRKKNEDFSSATSKSSNKSLVGQIEVESNQKIMKSFKQLREKLRLSTKQNQSLREQINTYQIQIRQLQESENNLTVINHQLREKNNQIGLSNEQLKKKLSLLKQNLNQKVHVQQERDFMKSNLIEMTMKIEKLEQQKKKLIEISVQDKLVLEQQVNKLKIKQNSDNEYAQEIEQQLLKSKENLLKIQNQLRKNQIKYEEQIFNKKWSKQNFQKEYYENLIKQLNQQISELKSKNKKQKEKRSNLEKRVIQLEQTSGLWNVKAQTYEGEVQMMTKKVKKMERRMSQAKSTADKMANEKISWQQKFTRSIIICEELIARVKRDLVGDVVQLAKTCEFKINKLKQNDQKRDALSSGKKCNSKKNKKSLEKDNLLKLSNQNFFSKLENQNKNFIQNIHEISFEECQENKKQKIFITKEVLCNKQNEYNKQRQIATLELKIRKERQQMQKKLKQKMLYRKIDVCSSPDKYKARGNYLNHIFDRKL